MHHPIQKPRKELAFQQTRVWTSIIAITITIITQEVLQGREHIILTSTYTRYTGRKWYTSDVNVVITDFYAYVPPWHLYPGVEEISILFIARRRQLASRRRPLQIACHPRASRVVKKDGNIDTVETVPHDLPAVVSKLVTNPIGSIRLSVTVQNDDVLAQQPTPWDKLPQPLTYLHNSYQLRVIIMVNEADKKHALMVRKGSWRDFPYWRRCVKFLRSGLQWVFPRHWHFSGFGCQLINTCFIPCNKSLQKLISLVGVTSKCIEEAPIRQVCGHLWDLAPRMPTHTHFAIMHLVVDNVMRTTERNV